MAQPLSALWHWWQFHEYKYECTSIGSILHIGISIGIGVSLLNILSYFLLSEEEIIFKLLPITKQLICFCERADLQWTTMGPASGGLHVFTRRRKAKMGVGYSGTPWSGQAMNWNCLTSRFSLEPFCRQRERGKMQNTRDSLAESEHHRQKFRRKRFSVQIDFRFYTLHPPTSGIILGTKPLHIISQQFHKYFWFKTKLLLQTFNELILIMLKYKQVMEKWAKEK